MSASTEKEFRFNFDARYRAAARLFGITDRRAVVRVFDRDFTARFGPWTAYMPLANISAAEAGFLFWSFVVLMPRANPVDGRAP
jgi:hypothetical protein